MVLRTGVGVVLIAVLAACAPETSSPTTAGTGGAASSPATHAKKPSLFAICMENPSVLDSLDPSTLAKWKGAYGGNYQTALCWYIVHDHGKGPMPDPEMFN